ncbi:RIC1-domain-containing protein [Neohortaea acidophila]|uniref:RIC1-domain-containing protein n=1 Tax=Neohortaea acidophila TaxID=245834 RepID=A0A6A6PXG9_9PEZI|nr:RIC1-domain-containing protein [Neohortaea acidophila]KAF2484451.1 RIC1-domain-containing protein [Neohortaea acidophila]
MYWPTGAPQAYALSRHRTSAAPVTPTEAHYPDAPATSEAAGDNEAQGREDDDIREHIILSAKASRGGTIFATITASALTIWQTKPTLALASITRSAESVKAYGPNATLLLRPDALVIAVQTPQNYLIIYTVAADPNARVYQTELSTLSSHARRTSAGGPLSYRHLSDAGGALAEADGIKEVNLCFRMVMRIDAGINTALALDEELVVATEHPAALQCISWPEPESVNAKKSAQASTELLSRMPWLVNRSNIVEMVHDRPMNLTCWVMSDGRTYAVQRHSSGHVDTDTSASLFHGYCFRAPEPEEQGTYGVRAAINARFSLIAVGRADRGIDVYAVKDYTGNIPLSHKLRLSVPHTSSGGLLCLSYSPDGYCLFAGYEKGWATWSVYGQAGASSFMQGREASMSTDEPYRRSAKDVFWIGGGCELMLLPKDDDRLWSLQMARSAITGCFNSASLPWGLLVTSDHVKIYKGHDAPDATTATSEPWLWKSVQIPASYLLSQWPIKSAVVSSDGKYIAVAGRRGLVHYSVSSGRWRVFDDLAAEQEFSIRGGMCWFRHFLLACVECSSEDARYQIRLYSREKALNHSSIQHAERLATSAVFMTTTGTNSLLVYTQDNTLLHFLIVPNASSVRLTKVGQTGFHGIIRAPPRVRSISWLRLEEPADDDVPQDITKALLLFLVDGKLVLLQPTTSEQAEVKYDMCVLAQNVEYYILVRDMAGILVDLQRQMRDIPLFHDARVGQSFARSLLDSLWYFNGRDFQVWLDTQDLVAHARTETGRDLPCTVQIPVDFYPLLPLVMSGIVHGLDADLVQRRDVDFSFSRLAPRTQLFLPQLLEHHLAQFNSSAALHVCEAFQHLPYFPHALEIMLHDVLDAAVDSPPASPELALLSTAVSFLSSFPSYLDVIVNCTRKTELRSWKTLFSCLPPVLDLFEQSLSQGKLKTAAGYLLVLHTLEGDEELGNSQEAEHTKLLTAAAAAHDWELCSELARFMVGIDRSGTTLRAALSGAGLGAATNGVAPVEHSERVSEDTPSKGSALSDSDENSRAETNGKDEGALD